MAPTEHADQLAQIRPLVAGEKVLFLGRDDFVLYELRGSKPFTARAQLLRPVLRRAQLRARRRLREVRLRLGHRPQTLARFPYVITTRAAYASSAAARLRAGAADRRLRALAPAARAPLGREPGENGRRAGPDRRLSRRRQAAPRSSSFARRRSPRARDAWSQTTVESGESADAPSSTCRRVAGTSRSNTTPRDPVTVAARRASTQTLPGQPRLPRHRPRTGRPGRSPSDGGPIAGRGRRSSDPPLAGRLLGAHSVAHLGAIAAMRVGRSEPQLRRLRRLVRALMDLSFGEATLIFGGLLAVTAALSGLIRGTVLSASVLSIALGIVLAELDVVSVDVGDEGIVEPDRAGADPHAGLRRAARRPGAARAPLGPPARALVIAMPITLALLAVGAKLLFSDLAWAEAFLLGAVLCATDPVVTSSVVTSRAVPATIRHTLNLESGLNDGLALPFVLFFLVLASPGGDAGERGRAARRRGGVRRA